MRADQHLFEMEALLDAYRMRHQNMVQNSDYMERTLKARDQEIVDLKKRLQATCAVKP